jgi:hypothetical protein
VAGRLCSRQCGTAFTTHVTAIDAIGWKATVDQQIEPFCL